MAKKTKPKKSQKKPAAKRKTAPKAKTRPIPKGSAEQTPVKVLQGLTTLAAQCKSRSRTASGDIGQAIKDAAENQNLHPQAFRLVNRWHEIGGVDPLKLRSLLDAVDYYRDALKLDDIKAPNLLASTKKKTDRTTKPRASGDMKPIGEAATNVVNLAGAMAKAIEDDKASQPKGEMVG